MTNSTDSETKIAGSLTGSDWRKAKESLVVGGTPALWKCVFQNYFFQRLTLRYLTPIQNIQAGQRFEGEGFSIVTLQCAFIEFLASTRAGKNYNHSEPGEYEYNKSGPEFEGFLSKTLPFSQWFDKAGAQDFYKNVRCGLVHEAATKNGWRIKANDTKSDHDVCCTCKIVYRDNLKKALDNYVESYRDEIVSNCDFQKAFIRKFDHLAA